jgi:hypothetical protein
MDVKYAPNFSTIKHASEDNERNIILALQAMQNDPKLSARAAGKIYTCDHQTLSRRRRGVKPRRDISANSRKLTDLEKSVLVQYILDLATKEFPPRLSIAEDMANRLLATCDKSRVGIRWVLTLSSAAQSFGHASSANTTTRELSAKIQKLFVAGLSLYETQLRSMESRRPTFKTTRPC